MTHMYFSARAEGRISYDHLGRTSLFIMFLRHCVSFYQSIQTFYDNNIGCPLIMKRRTFIRAVQGWE